MALVIALLVSMLVSCVLGYSSGPPVSSVTGLCSSMTPSHGPTAQTSTSDYSVTVDSTCYKPGMQLTVTVTGTPSTNTIAGMFVQARPTTGANTGESFGTFSNNGNTKLSTQDCFTRTTNSIGHNTNLNTASVSFTWTAPTTGFTENIKFRATVVKTKSIFWVGVLSNEIVYNSNCAMASTTTTTTLSTSTVSTSTNTNTATTPSGAQRPHYSTTSALIGSFIVMFFGFLYGRHL